MQYLKAALLLAFFSLVGPTAAKSISDETLRKLMDAAAATRRRHLDAPFAWTATLTARDGGKAILDVSESGSQRIIEFSEISPSQQSRAMGTLVITTNAWFYKLPNGRQSKYRPWEAPLGFLYTMLSASSLLYFDQAKIQFEEVISETNGVLEVAVKKDPRTAAALNKLQALADRAQAEADLTPKDLELLERIKQITRKGLIFKLDTKTGLVLERGAGGEMLIELGNFQWKKRLDFQLDKDFDDFSSAPPGLGTDTIIMAAKTGPAGMNAEDIYYIDLARAWYRRVPSEQPIVEPGCFFPGRRKVIVHVKSLNAGAIHPVLVDLDTGLNTSFGSWELSEPLRFSSGGALSPNEKEVALLERAAGDVYDKRINIVEIESNRTRPFGRPGNYNFIKWLHSERAFVVDRMKTDPTDPKRLAREVGIVREDGSYRSFGAARDPAVLPGRAPESERILLCRLPEERWVTVDLQGENEREFPAKLGPLNGWLTTDPHWELLMAGELHRAQEKRWGTDSVKIIKLETNEIRSVPLPPGSWFNFVWGD